MLPNCGRLFEVVPMAKFPINVDVPVVDVALMMPNVPIEAARILPVDNVVVAPEFEK